MDQQTPFPVPGALPAENLPITHHTGLTPQDWGAIWVATFILIVFALTYIITWIRKAFLIDKQPLVSHPSTSGGSSYSPVFTVSAGMDTVDISQSSSGEEGLWEGEAERCRGRSREDHKVETDCSVLSDWMHTDPKAGECNAIVVTIENETALTHYDQALQMQSDMTEEIPDHLTASPAHLMASPAQLTASPVHLTASPDLTASIPLTASRHLAASRPIRAASPPFTASLPDLTSPHRTASRHLTVSLQNKASQTPTASYFTASLTATASPPDLPASLSIASTAGTVVHNVDSIACTVGNQASPHH